MYSTGDFHCLQFKGGWFPKHALFKDHIFVSFSFAALFVLVAPLSAMPFSSLSFPPLSSQSTALFHHTIRHLSPPTSQILTGFPHFLPTVSKIKGIINKINKKEKKKPHKQFKLEKAMK